MVLALLSTAAFAAWPDHVTTAQGYEDAIAAMNNVYGSPSSVWWDSHGTIHAKAQCGGYAALLLRNTYSSVTTRVLTGLTGSSSPSAKQWNDAIDASATYTSGASSFRLSPRASVDVIAPGDILASEYTSGSSSGHVMIVASITLDSMSVSTSIPGEATAERWLVEVHDSTSSPHGSTDTRYHAESSGADDSGIGNGLIYLYADQASGAIVGWTWSTSSSTTYQGTSSTSANYRPMTAGVLTGTGL